MPACRPRRAAVRGGTGELVVDLADLTRLLLVTRLHRVLRTATSEPPCA